MLHNTSKAICTAVGVSFTSSLSAFVKDSLNDIATWLLVMFCVIILDLMMSIYKLLKVKERKQARGIPLEASDKIRWSKGLRDTMAKIATYFAFVVAMVFVSNASHISNLHIYGCMAVIAGESLSIVGNWCKAHGYNFSATKLLNWGASKVNLPKDIIKEDDGENKSSGR